MPKWEYMLVDIHWDGLLGQPKPRRVNGGELTNWKNTTLPDFLIKLGEEGWELSAPFAGVYGVTVALVFKRPKP